MGVLSLKIVPGSLLVAYYNRKIARNCHLDPKPSEKTIYAVAIAGAGASVVRGPGMWVNGLKQCL